MMRRTALLTMLLTVGCATSSGPGTVEEGTRELSRYSVLYEGPEIEAIVRTHQAQHDLGEEWLILVVQMRGTHGSGITEIHRTDISVRTPAGRRLPLINDDEYRRIFGEIRSRVNRALSATPEFGLNDISFRPCDRWFLEEPAGGFARDVVPLSVFGVCSGPLVFRVHGGIQPGRWRLVIELEESRADIPFELELND